MALFQRAAIGWRQFHASRHIPPSRTLFDCPIKVSYFCIRLFPKIGSRDHRHDERRPDQDTKTVLPTMPTDILDSPQLKPADTKKPYRILIVDDDEAMVDVLSLRLARQGFETLAATSGEQGLALARSERPALILLDLRLPGVDGFTICQQLVDGSETCDIPVIIVSGMERPDIIRQCRSAGCQYFVRKPYDPNALLVLIQQSIKGWMEE